MPPTAQPLALEAHQIPFADIPRDCWDRLLARTARSSPFSRWTFHRAWWDAYGESAHEEYLACVPRGTDSGDAIDWQQVRAIVPLMHRHEVEPDDELTHTVLREHEATARPVQADAKAVFFAASYHADYATILCAPDELPAVTAAIGDLLARQSEPDRQAWDVIDLRRLSSDDPALAALEHALRRPPGWQVFREREDVCPVIEASGEGWDDYLASLGKKDRHEIRRKLRRAAAVGELRIEIAEPSEAAMESFIELHRLRFGERGLFPSGPGGDRSRRFVHRLAELESQSSSPQLHVGLVSCGERLIYAMLAFDDGHTCFLYNAGMDPAAADVSPGITGTAEYLRNRLAAGRRRFDFLRGNEAYKYEWGARDEPIERLLVVRELS